MKTHEPLTTARRKLVRSLGRKKGRSENGMYVVEGVRLVNELATCSERAVFLYGTEESLRSLDAELAGIPAFTMESFDRELYHTEHPQGVGAVVRVGEVPSIAVMSEIAAPLLYLDSIGDPGNAGTILRTAEWFGIGGVLFGKGSVDPYNPKVVRSSMGSILRIPIRTDCSTEEACSLARPVFVLDRSGDAVLGRILLKKRGLYVVGSEAHGTDPAWLGKGTPLAIPGSSRVDTLNAATAASILCWELSRLD